MRIALDVTSALTPCCQLQGLAPEGLPGFEWVKTVIDAKSLAYIGLRDVDPYEKLFIENLGIKVITIPDVDRYGIERSGSIKRM